MFVKAKMSNYNDTNATYTATVGETHLNVSLLEKLTLTLAREANIDIRLLERLKLLLPC